MSEAFSKIPAGMLVKYADVQNVIASKMNALSRKHVTDKESVRLWMEVLRQDRFYSVKYEVSDDPNGPFIVSWMSPWQKMVCLFYTRIIIVDNLFYYRSLKRPKSGVLTPRIRQVSRSLTQKKIVICLQLLYVTK
jgi:hypothetical protein